MYETVIPAGKASEADLIALVDSLKVVTKSDIKFEAQYVIRTEDIEISSMLYGLVKSLSKGEPATRSNGHKKQGKKSKKAQGNGAMTSHQVRIEDTGEILSTQAFNKRLAAGEVAELTNVSNAKGQKFVVIDQQLAKAPQS